MCSHTLIFSPPWSVRNEVVVQNLLHLTKLLRNGFRFVFATRYVRDDPRETINRSMCDNATYLVYSDCRGVLQNWADLQNIPCV